MCRKKVFYLKMYILILYFGMFISNFFVIIDRTTTFWLINLAGYLVFFICFLKGKKTNLLSIGLAACLISASFFTVAFHSHHIFDNTKSLGLNVNIIIVSCNIILFFDDKDFYISTNDFISICKLVFILGIISSIYNLLDNYKSLTLIFNTYNSYTIASRSFFDNKNTFGAVCMLSIASGLYLIFNVKRHTKVIILGLVLLVLNLIISFSRTALLSTGIFAFIYLLLIFRSKEKFDNWQKKYFKMIKCLILILAISAFGLFIFNPKINNFVINMVFRKDFGDAGRKEIWLDGLGYLNGGIVDSLFGIGYSQMNYYGTTYLHNVYLELFVSGGLLKCLVYFAILLKPIVNYRRTKNKSLANYLSIAMLLSYLVYAFFESQIIFELGIVPFLFMTLIYMTPNKTKSIFTNEYYLLGWKNVSLHYNFELC